jgi:hypothetical protein
VGIIHAFADLARVLLPERAAYQIVLCHGSASL